MNRRCDDNSSSGEMIAPRLRARLEDHFWTDLSSVRVRTDATAHSLNVDAESYALAIGESIFFRSGVYDPEHVIGQLVVAHEVSHVLQKRRYVELGERTVCRRISSARNLEIEADRSAFAFCRGDSAGPLSPDHPQIARAFGPVGHYYTVFYLAMAAGFERAAAADLAFYAQLPDEITELDAKDVVVKWLTNYLKIIKGPRGTKAVLEWLTNGYGKGDVLDYMILPHDFLATIQRGLHCLTGGSSQTETEYRTQRLMAGNVGTPQFFGLAIHAFADSFAHRTIGDVKIMYTAPAGHLATCWRISDIEILLKKGQHSGWATWVDNIGHRPELYVEYGTKLFKILRQKSGKGMRLPDPQVEQDLKKFSANPDELGQENLIKSAITRLADNSRVAFYEPKESTASWSTSTNLDGRPKPSYEDILHHAATWSRWRPLIDQVVLKFADVTINTSVIPSPTAVLSRKSRAAVAALESGISQAVRRGSL
jgi:uncharacterized protein DUF4157